MVALAVLRAPEVRSRQGRAEGGSFEQGQCRGTTTAAPRAPVEEQQGTPEQIHPWESIPFREREVAGGALRKEGSSPISTAVLGQLKALGSPLTCLQVPQEEMLEDRSSLPRDNSPILS